MIRKITLQNFMSHRRTVIEPANGLTVLVGENNCGKSAVVAALQILCNNAGGDYMVRHGENECRIVVETDEGHVVEWKRKNGTVSYTLNGEVVHRLRGGVPDDLHGLLRLAQVHPQDGDPFDIHFGEQKKPVFLLDESGGRAAKFFASSSDAEVLIRMQGLHKDNVREAVRTSNRLQDELKFLDRRLRPLETVPDIQERLDNLESQYDVLVTTEKKLDDLGQHAERLREAVGQTFFLDEKASVLGELKIPPRMGDTDSLSELLESFDAWQYRFTLFEQQEHVLRDLQAPPKLIDTETIEALHDLIERLREAHSQTRLHESEASVLGELKAPPSMGDTGSLTELVRNLDVSRRLCSRFEHHEHVLEDLQAPPKLADTETLEALTLDMARDNHAVQRVSDVILTLSDLNTPPELAPVRDLQIAFEQMKSCIDDMQCQHTKTECFAQLNPTPELFDLRSLGELIEQIASTTIWTVRSQEQFKTLGRCNVPPHLYDVSAFIDLIDDFELFAVNTATRSLSCMILSALELPPSMVDPNELATMIANVESDQENVSVLKEVFERATSSAADAETALRAWALENRICPTCGAELDPDKLIAMAVTPSRGHVHE